MKKHVISYLGDFLFAPQRARSPVKSLSGGERNRLLLARLFARPANVLVLDEPTNDLDIETLELLTRAAADYAGTLFLVSHDRAFLDAVVTQTIAAEGDGVWHEYAGGYSDWADYQSRRNAAQSTAAAQAARAKAEPRAAAKPKTSRPTACRTKDQRELEALPDRMPRLKPSKSLTGRLEDPASTPATRRRRRAWQAGCRKSTMRCWPCWNAGKAWSRGRRHRRGRGARATRISQTTGGKDDDFQAAARGMCRRPLHQRRPGRPAGKKAAAPGLPPVTVLCSRALPLPSTGPSTCARTVSPR